jgi:hypothetical protein
MANDRAERGIQVMEHREPPRIAIGDRRFEETQKASHVWFPLRRSDPAGSRRPREARRAALPAIVVSAVAAGLIYVGWQATRAAVAWLHHQSQYQVPFKDLELVRSPPAWYRGGARRFLEQVGQNAAEPARVSQLDVRPDQLAVAFKKYAWVEDVAKVAYSPGRIRVDLRYRRPVAWVNLPRGQQQIVDDRGIILSVEDVDVEPLGSLVKITGDGVFAPSDPRPGVVWKAKEHVGEPDEADGRIVGAARLAGFLRQEERASEAAACPALRILEIIVTDYDRRGLFVMNAEGAEIWWEDAPGRERPGKLSASEKWRMLVRWQATTRARFLEAGDFWAFSRKGVLFNCPPTHSSRHEPRTSTPPP